MTSQGGEDPNSSGDPAASNAALPSGDSSGNGNSGEGDQGRRNVRSQRSEDRRLALYGLAGALAGAILGGLFSFWGSWQQARTQLEAQVAQNREDRSKEDREKKAEVYEEFLDTANSFAVETNKIITDCKDGKCSPDWDKWQTARYNYQGAVNRVSVWGSDAASDQMAELSETLPNSLWSPDSDSISLHFKSKEFSVSYLAFQSLMCRELPANPRKGC